MQYDTASESIAIARSVIGSRPARRDSIVGSVKPGDALADGSLPWNNFVPNSGLRKKIFFVVIYGSSKRCRLSSSTKVDAQSARNWTVVDRQSLQRGTRKCADITVGAVPLVGTC